MNLYIVFGSRNVLCNNLLLEINHRGGTNDRNIIYILIELSIIGAVAYIKMTITPI